jgi:hypothetical protein
MVNEQLIFETRYSQVILLRVALPLALISLSLFFSIWKSGYQTSWWLTSLSVFLYASIEILRNNLGCIEILKRFGYLSGVMLAIGIATLNVHVLFWLNISTLVFLGYDFFRAFVKYKRGFFRITNRRLVVDGTKGSLDILLHQVEGIDCLRHPFIPFPLSSRRLRIRGVGGNTISFEDVKDGVTFRRNAYNLITSMRQQF